MSADKITIICPSCGHEQEMNEDFLERYSTVICESCMESNSIEKWKEDLQEGKTK